MPGQSPRRRCDDPGSFARRRQRGCSSIGGRPRRGLQRGWRWRGPSHGHRRARWAIAAAVEIGRAGPPIRLDDHRHDDGR
eukprot:7655195-Pyramimonas_sp.AAC.1